MRYMIFLNIYIYTVVSKLQPSKSNKNGSFKIIYQDIRIDNTINRAKKRIFLFQNYIKNLKIYKSREL